MELGHFRCGNVYGPCWRLFIAIGALCLATTCYAETSRLDLDVLISGDWDQTTYYEAATWNNGWPDPFNLSDAGDDQAYVMVEGERTRPTIDPWPFPGTPVVYTTMDVPIGLSSAYLNALSVRADALLDWNTGGDDIEGYARILHLTPTVDQTIEVKVDYYMRSVGGVFWGDIRMFDEAATEPVNLLPSDINRYRVKPREGTVVGTDTASIQVQAGKSYTFEVEYDIYPGFVPEPGTLMLFGIGSLTVLRRKNG